MIGDAGLQTAWLVCSGLKYNFRPSLERQTKIILSQVLFLG